MERLKKDQAYLFDGSFSQLLEEISFDSASHPLWTSGASNEQTKAVYRKFKELGCQIVSTNTYHASQILVKKYFKEEKIDGNPREFVAEPIKSAFEIYKTGTESRDTDFPIILGSVGPYGVSLRDASEYHGNYVDQQEHLEKISFYQEEHFKLLKSFGVEVILYETIPAHQEAIIFLQTIEKLKIPAVISFSCKDKVSLRHGTPLRDTVSEVLKCKWIQGIGINCTNPLNVPGLLKEINASTIRIPVFVYPNSGEMWDSVNNCYSNESTEKIEWKNFVAECYDLGANVFGGCCRIGTTELKEIAKAVDMINEKKKF